MIFYNQFIVNCLSFLIERYDQSIMLRRLLQKFLSELLSPEISRKVWVAREHKIGFGAKIFIIMKYNKAD